MAGITLNMTVEGFEELPLIIPEDQIIVNGSLLMATLDVSAIAQNRGNDFSTYVMRLKEMTHSSKFRLSYTLMVRSIAPEKLSVDLSMVHFIDVDFRTTDLSTATMSDGVTLTRCLIDDSLPAISVHPGEVFRYPPLKGARELGITDPKHVFVLRWGLSQDGLHVGQAFLWLEKHYPHTEVVLSRLLKGLPARPPKRTPWSP